MEHQFATRSTQAVSQPQQQHQQSQHIYSAPAYNVYQSQPGYLAGLFSFSTILEVSNSISLSFFNKILRYSFSSYSIKWKTKENA